ncbi:MAG: GTPase ObgE [Chloroflexi bacterium]|nr:GTPase ObgE [Chloroflexota bacterium]
MIDIAEIHVQAGNGGDGCRSFRREKYVPRGGPDGGGGGRGGSVFLEAVPGETTLVHTRTRQRFRAVAGGRGRGVKKEGGDGKDLVVQVPVGTIIYARGSSGQWERLADLAVSGQRVLVAKGGVGGRGNTSFVSPVNQEPLLMEEGEKGEEAWLRLEVKLLADVGIIGVPNAGKSSLLARVSAAQPKIADYPFTTTEPVLGVVDFGESSFVMVEIPGLIEGAHKGAGLGLEFLRHAERTRLLLHLIDGTSQSPVGDYEMVLRELVYFGPELAGKPQVVVVNKVDLPEVSQQQREIHQVLSSVRWPILFISAATGEGVSALLGKLLELLSTLKAQEGEKSPSLPSVIVPPRPHPPRIVRREGEHVFIVQWPQAERLAAPARLDDWRVVAQLWKELERLGVVRALLAQGIQVGDTVRIGKKELNWG